MTEGVAMRRAIEWLVAAVAGLLAVGGAVWLTLNQVAGPLAGPLWPLPGLVLLDIGLLGLAGFAGLAFDDGRRASRWPQATWIASGGLAAIGVIGAFGVSVIAFALGPALLFGLAALLADRHQGRRLQPGLSTFVLSAGVNALLVALLVSLQRAM